MRVPHFLFMLGLLSSAAELHAKPPVAELVTLPTAAPVIQFSLAQSGRIAAGLGKDGVLRVWALPDGRLLRSVDAGTNQFLAASFSRDGKFMQTSTWNGDVTVWDSATGAEVSHVRVSNYSSAVAFSRDDQLLAVASSFAPVQLIALPSGRKRCELGGTVGGTQALAFSPDGTRVATADGDTRVRVYDAQSGRLLTTQEEFLMDALAIDFTADGKEVVAAGADKRAIFFDALTGQVRTRLKKQSYPVAYLEVSADGKSLALVHFDDRSAARPAPLLVSDTFSGRKLNEWLPPSAIVGSAWTAEGHYLAATLSTDAVHIWRVD